MQTIFLWLTLSTAALACGGASTSSTPASGPADGQHGHTYAECNESGHPRWRTDTHPSRDMTEDEAKLHVAKFPGHKPVIRETDHP